MKMPGNICVIDVKVKVNADLFCLDDIVSLTRTGSYSDEGPCSSECFSDHI